jgi:hypothetical protein
MRNSTLAFAVLLACGASSRPNNSVAQTSTEKDSTSGSICVLPNSPEPPTRISPGGEYNPDTLMVRVDKREPIRWPHNKPLLVENLDMQDSHLVVLTSDGKQIQSFRFKFSDYHDAKLCVYFDGYQGVQLGNRTDALWCKVKNRDCWRYIVQGIVGASFGLETLFREVGSPNGTATHFIKRHCPVNEASGKDFIIQLLQNSRGSREGN